MVYNGISDTFGEVFDIKPFIMRQMFIATSKLTFQRTLQSTVNSTIQLFRYLTLAKHLPSYSVDLEWN